MRVFAAISLEYRGGIKPLPNHLVQVHAIVRVDVV